MTDVSTSLPDLVWAPGMTITVTLDDASGDVTLLNVYGFTPTLDTVEPPAEFVPQFTYGAA